MRLAEGAETTGPPPPQATWKRNARNIIAAAPTRKNLRRVAAPPTSNITSTAATATGQYLAAGAARQLARKGDRRSQPRGGRRFEGGAAAGRGTVLSVSVDVCALAGVTVGGLNKQFVSGGRFAQLSVTACV